MKAKSKAALKAIDATATSPTDSQLAGPNAANANFVDPQTLPKVPDELSGQDASALQSLLAKRFGDDLGTQTVTAMDAPVRQEAPNASPSHLKSRLIKSALGLALVAAVGWMPAQRLFQVSSVEAVVNARLVTVRSPINGIIASGANALQVGDAVEPGNPLLAIENARIDRSAINAAIDRLQQAKDDRRGLVVQLDSQKRLQRDLEARISAFRTNRVRLIDAQITEADARLASALAIEDRAGVTLERHTTLTGQGYLSTAAVDDARRDMEVAKASANEARASKAALVIEANALRDGHFFGDNYNDEPQSAHRLDDVNQSIATLNGEIDLQDHRIASAALALQRAQDAFSVASEARLVSPVTGQLWEILTAPGEQVVEGQDLARLLDCSKAIVTAAVSESVYNGLTLGMPTSFTFTEGGPALPGHVVQLSGVSPASSNFAIMPSALTKESYRVAIAVEGASQSGSCAVGRTGRVVFQSPAK